MSSQIPTNPTSQTVAALLPKLHDADPDYRFMSLNDLFQVLTIGKADFLHNDYNTSARTVDGILKTLDDQNGEVQNLAIKCLAPLVTKLQGNILAPLIDKLSTLSTENSVDNSIPSMALRTVVVTLPRPVPGVAASRELNEAYSAISRVLIPRLVGHVVIEKADRHTKLPQPPEGMLELQKNKDIDGEAVDVLIEVVRCFGPMLQEAEVEALQSLVVSLLRADRVSSVVKKRAVVSVSILAVYLSDDYLSNFVSQLIETLRNPHLFPIQRRIYITILGSMARSIPTRFGPYLKTLAPFVLSALSRQELSDQFENAAEVGEPTLEIDDVREAALVALEGFLASCGGEMRLYTDESIAAALRFLKYDPNYNDDEDEEMGGTQTDEDDMDNLDDDDNFDAADGFDDDDDDTSWKVRRCAAKVLYTLISTRGGELLEDGTLYKQVAPVLVQRFSEREENVRLEVIATLSSLVRKTGESVLIDQVLEDGSSLAHAPPSRKRRRESSSTVTHNTKAFLSMSAGLTSPAIDQAPNSGPRAELSMLTSAIIKSASKLLKNSTIASKQAIITLLDETISIQNGGLSDYLAQIVDPIVDAIKPSSGSLGSSNAITTGGAASATSSTLRMAALKLVGDLAKTHSSKVLQPYLPKIVPGVVSAVTDKFYKISGEAIGTVEQLVKAFTPPRSLSMNQTQQPNLQKLYHVIVDRVSATDADLEVRQRAISALGILLARTAGPDGAALLSTADRNSALNLLSDRLRNETTRLAAVRAIDTIAALSISKDQLQPKWVREVALELSAQLRKANRSLRGASLAALKNLMVAPTIRASLDAPTIQGLVSALLPLLTPNDLHLVGPALLVVAALVLDDPSVVSLQMNRAICELLVSWVGDAVLDAVLVLVTNIGQRGVGQSLMDGLLEQVGINGDPTVVGKVIGTLLVSGGSSLNVTLDTFLKELQASQDDKSKCLALAVLGESGLRLGAKSNMSPSIFTAQFEAHSDRVPIAAAVALGRAGAGNIPVYMPEILKTMDKVGNRQYLLLHSIKEVLHQATNSSLDISAYSKLIWDMLLSASQAEDNKAVGAECIGRLAIIDPKNYISQLKDYLSDPSSSVRAMAIQALRYTLPDSDEAFDAVLKTSLIQMLNIMMQDTELENRRLALTTMNAAAHSKPHLLIPSLSSLLPLVIKESLPKPELVREVMMGPFKHKVDDGLEVRKSAYETLYALMEIAFYRINILEFYDRIIAGLRDDHDIRGLCNLMLTKLVILDPDETGRRLDAIADCFRSILSTKLKDNAVKQEVEKQDEAVKSALRVTLILHTAIPTANSGTVAQGSQHQTWRVYWEWVEKDFDGRLRELREESKDVLA